jgi:hypothetical protein
MMTMAMMPVVLTRCIRSCVGVRRRRTLSARSTRSRRNIGTRGSAATATGECERDQEEADCVYLHGAITLAAALLIPFTVVAVYR